MPLVTEEWITVNEGDELVDTEVDVQDGQRIVLNADGSIWAGVWFTGQMVRRGGIRLQMTRNSGCRTLIRMLCLDYSTTSILRLGPGWSAVTTRALAVPAGSTCESMTTRPATETAPLAAGFKSGRTR